MILDDVFSFLFLVLLRIIIVVIGIVFVVTCMEDLICIIASFLFYHHPLFLLRHPPSPRPSPRWRTWINQGWQVRPRQNALGRLARFNDLGQRSARCRRCSLGVVGRGCWACVLILVFFEGLRRCFFQQGVLLCYVLLWWSFYWRILLSLFFIPSIVFPIIRWLCIYFLVPHLILTCIAFDHYLYHLPLLFTDSLLALHSILNPCRYY